MKLSVQDFAEIVGTLRGESSSVGAHEKRRAVRMEVNAKLVVGLLNDKAIGQKYSVLTRDISLAGIGLLQSIALQQGQEFVLSLPRSTHKPPLFFVAVVLHCRPLADGLYGLGCEFVREAPAAMGEKLIRDQDSEHARIRNSVLA